MTRKRAVYVRVGDALHAVLNQAGRERSATARALLFVGAYHAGIDVSKAGPEMYEALASGLEPDVYEALRWAMRLDDTPRPPQPKPAPRPPQRRPVNDPLLDEGIEG